MVNSSIKQATLVRIYGLYDQDELIYIGRTVRKLDRRLKEHIKYSNSGNSKREAYIRSMSTPPTIKLIEERYCNTSKEVRDFEQGYIDRFSPFLNSKKADLLTLPSGDHWNDDVIGKLGTMPDTELAKLTGLGKSSIQVKRESLGIAPFSHKKKKWQPWEIAILGTDLDVAIARQLNRTKESVTIKRRKMNIKSYRSQEPWTQEELDLLGTDTDQNIANRLGRNKHTVRNTREASNIKPYITPGQEWEDWEVQLIKGGNLTNDEIAAITGYTKERVMRKRYKLTLKNSTN